jgi:hypothetical protein
VRQAIEERKKSCARQRKEQEADASSTSQLSLVVSLNTHHGRELNTDTHTRTRKSTKALRMALLLGVHIGYIFLQALTALSHSSAQLI